jgi:hypothetical protein
MALNLSTPLGPSEDDCRGVDDDDVWGCWIDDGVKGGGGSSPHLRRS